MNTTINDCIKSYIYPMVKKSERLPEMADAALARGDDATAERLHLRERLTDSYLNGACDMLRIFGFDYRATCDENGDFSGVEIFSIK